MFGTAAITLGIGPHSSCYWLCIRQCICCTCVIREASTLVEDLKGVVEELEQDQQMSLINVELVDDELARIYANSNKAQVSSLVSSRLIRSHLTTTTPQPFYGPFPGPPG